MSEYASNHLHLLLLLPPSLAPFVVSDLELLAVESRVYRRRSKGDLSKHACETYTSCQCGPLQSERYIRRVVYNEMTVF